MRIDEYVGFDGLGLAALIRGGEVSAAELLDTALAQAVATDGLGAVVDVQEAVAHGVDPMIAFRLEIGRASCRERV